MIKDYYDILALKHDASSSQIAQQYKRLVLRWHPRFAKQDQKTAHFHFSQVSEAFEVLSDPLKRAFYDRYGYLKLRQGLFFEGQLKGGYRFAENPDQIFEKFYHSHNTLAQTVESQIAQRGSLFGFGFGGLNYKQNHQLENLIVEVPCKLHELYLGVAKHVSYERRVLHLDGRTTSLKKQQKYLQIHPGSGSDSKIVLKGEGHDYVNRKSSDLIFKIVQQNHTSFIRQGDNLIYTQDISLIDSLSSEHIKVVTLDNRLLRIPIDQIINPSSIIQVSNEGMPIGKKGRGHLYIKFNIVFPKQISEQNKKQLRTLLS